MIRKCFRQNILGKRLVFMAGGEGNSAEHYQQEAKKFPEKVEKIVTGIDAELEQKDAAVACNEAKARIDKLAFEARPTYYGGANIDKDMVAVKDQLNRKINESVREAREKIDGNKNLYEKKREAYGTFNQAELRFVGVTNKIHDLTLDKHFDITNIGHPQLKIKIDEMQQSAGSVLGLKGDYEKIQKTLFDLKPLGGPEYAKRIDGKLAVVAAKIAALTSAHSGALRAIAEAQAEYAKPLDKKREMELERANVTKYYKDEQSKIDLKLAATKTVGSPEYRAFKFVAAEKTDFDGKDDNNKARIANVYFAGLNMKRVDLCKCRDDYGALMQKIDSDPVLASDQKKTQKAALDKTLRQINDVLKALDAKIGGLDKEGVKVSSDYLKAKQETEKKIRDNLRDAFAASVRVRDQGMRVSGKVGSAEHAKSYARALALIRVKNPAIYYQTLADLAKLKEQEAYCQSLNLLHGTDAGLPSDLKSARQHRNLRRRKFERKMRAG